MVSEKREQITVEKLVAGGDGLARLSDGRVVFVPGSAPGDELTVELVERKNDFGRVSIVDIVEPSPVRVAPRCPAVERGCGGCNWQHIGISAQAGLKRDIVAEAFARTARIDIAVKQGGLLPASTRRTAVRLAAGPDGRVGFRRGASHDVVVNGACMATHELIDSMIGELRLDGVGEVSVRVGARTGDIGLLAHGCQIVAGKPETARIGARARVREIVHGHTLTASMRSFFQNSPEAAELVVTTIAASFDGLGIESGRLIDLYGGVGLFAKCFADRFDELVVVEGNAAACHDALENLADCAATIECDDVDEWEPVEGDVVIADPSRSGLGKEGVYSVVGTDASFVALVSCDAVAAARDARLLIDSGYQLESVTSLDLFPDTHHVEVVSMFVGVE